MTSVTRRALSRARLTLTPAPGYGSAAPLLLLAMSAIVLAGPATAYANISHVFSTTIVGTGSKALAGPTDVELDQASHDIYVTDPGNHRVEKFTSSGDFLFMFGKEVNKTAIEESATRAAEENVCPAVGHPSDVCQAGTSSSSPGGFEAPTYLAVDNSGEPSAGDVYVADTGDNLVSKFDSSGNIVSGWGVAGQKNGSDASELPVFGPLDGVAVGGNGDLYVGGLHYSSNVWTYTPSGKYLPPYLNPGVAPWLKVDAAGNVYAGAPYAIDPSSGEVYEDVGPVIDHYSIDCNPELNGPCEPADLFGDGHLFGAMGIAVDGTSHTVYVANSTHNDVAVFSDVRPDVTTGPTVDVTARSVTLTGQIDPAGHGAITQCHFEYGTNRQYGHELPCSPDPEEAGSFSETTGVTAVVPNLSPGTEDHYRLVATNAAGATSDGFDRTFTTTQPPGVNGLRAEKLTATSAELIAEINPNGLKSVYRFEYGPTTSYGSSTPIPEGTISAGSEDQEQTVQLTGLTPHVVYHYRLVASNEDGTTITEDHAFNFYPPSCPNEAVRQQTLSGNLPDCRAYELVSPGNAGGTQLYPGGPNTGYATDPPRLAFAGASGVLPESGGSPIDANGDLYIATRTNTGWVSRYVGLPSSQAALDGGPPQGLPGSGFSGSSVELCSQPGGDCGPAKIQNPVLTDPGMDDFLEFDDGNPGVGANAQGDIGNQSTISSNAPYIYSAAGEFLERWPTDLGVVSPDLHALDCSRTLINSFEYAYNYCPGDVTASSNLRHFVFATEWNVFAPEGQLSPPGSVYDNETANATVQVVSKLPTGEPISPQPTDHAGDPLQIPAVSADGSRILMAAGGTGPCGSATCGSPPCGSSLNAAMRCPLRPSQLYMRIGDAVTRNISEGHIVDYVGMTSDGSKIYFTSNEQLTPEDQDASTDLYMWSQKGEEEGRPLMLISQGEGREAGDPGNTDACAVSIGTTSCGVVPYSGRSYCQLPGGIGGNCISDGAIASESGDIFFFSPEQLDGTRGIPGQWNLYDFHAGHDYFVATFGSGLACAPSGCSTNTPVVRMQVTPDGNHMAFVTASQITQYNNAGHLEMYTYEPAAEQVLCVSCNPSGAPPTSDVYASQDGLFLTNDGRVFFSTEEALVNDDTNNAQDVYEYVEGAPRLITQGTGDTRSSYVRGTNDENAPGLDGVSANGTDVYFSTYDTLVRQDRNGPFLKFYDARTDGGFPLPAPPPPCEAADECHGAGSAPPPSLQIETSAQLGPGNRPLRTPRRTHKRPGKGNVHDRHSRTSHRRPSQ